MSNDCTCPVCRLADDEVTTEDLMVLAIAQLQNAASLLAECGWHPERGSKFARVVVKNAMADEVAAGSFH